MKTFTVKRSEWAYGRDNNRLFNKGDNSYCCLGFASMNCNISAEAIDGAIFPSCIYLTAYMLLHPFYS